MNTHFPFPCMIVCIKNLYFMYPKMFEQHFEIKPWGVMETKLNKLIYIRNTIKMLLYYQQ